MPESLLDECYQSILKIAETQSHDGKRAVLALAEMFQDNSGRRSCDSQPSLSQNIRGPVARGYLLTGFDLDKRLDPVFPLRSLAIGYANCGSLAIRHYDHAQQG